MSVLYEPPVVAAAPGPAGPPLLHASAISAGFTHPAGRVSVSSRQISTAVHHSLSKAPCIRALAGPPQKPASLGSGAHLLLKTCTHTTFENHPGPSYVFFFTSLMATRFDCSAPPDYVQVLQCQAQALLAA